MKIKEVINESLEDFQSHYDDSGDTEFYDIDSDLDDDFDTDPYEDDPTMELSSNADKKIVNAILFICDKLKGEGNSRVDLLPFITQVSEKAGKIVRLADLIAVNKRSPEIQKIVDSIDEKSVKFKNTSVKNEDPKKANNKIKQNEATIKTMAGRAAARR